MGDNEKLVGWWIWSRYQQTWFWHVLTFLFMDSPSSSKFMHGPCCLTMSRVAGLELQRAIFCLPCKPMYIIIYIYDIPFNYMMCYQDNAIAICCIDIYNCKDSCDVFSAHEFCCNYRANYLARYTQTRSQFDAHRTSICKIRLWNLCSTCIPTWSKLMA